jgi:putative nucleotidyltransferase with HDIG domain
MSPVIAPAGAPSDAPSDGIDGLPALPIVALKLGEIVHGKSASVQQVADLLRSDPAMSARLLQLVNSPYFGIPGGVSDVGRAIPYVGFSTLYQIVLTISVLDALRIGRHDPRALWSHALTVATAARVLAEETRSADPGACFTAGLLHDLGELALARIAPDKVAATFETMRAERVAIGVAERHHGLTPHDELGGRLARRWGFPAALVAPIEHHHAIHRPAVRDQLTGPGRTVTEIVALADHLSLTCGGPDALARFGEDGALDATELFGRDGLAQLERDTLCDRLRAGLDRSRAFLALITG